MELDELTDTELFRLIVDAQQLICLNGLTHSELHHLIGEAHELMSAIDETLTKRDKTRKQEVT